MTLTDVLNRKILKLSGVDDSLVVILLANMPEKLRREAWNAIQLVYPEKVTNTNSKDPKYKWSVIHYSTYNRYCTQV